jgi:hypothetical protein
VVGLTGTFDFASRPLLRIKNNSQQRVMSAAARTDGCFVRAETSSSTQIWRFGTQPSHPHPTPRAASRVALLPAAARDDRARRDHPSGDSAIAAGWVGAPAPLRHPRPSRRRGRQAAPREELSGAGPSGCPLPPRACGPTDRAGCGCSGGCGRDGDACAPADGRAQCGVPLVRASGLTAPPRDTSPGGALPPTPAAAARGCFGGAELSSDA